MKMSVDDKSEVAGSMPPPATPSQAVSRARHLRSRIAEYGQAIDSDGVDPTEVMSLLADSGIQALNVPSSHGGLIGGSLFSGLRAFLEAWMEIAAGDGSVGQLWGFGGLGARNALCSEKLPVDVRARIADEYLHAGLRLSRLTSERGAATPTTSRRVAGGIRISGTKAFGTNTGAGGLAGVPHLLLGEDGLLTDAIPHLAFVRLDSPNVDLAHDWDNMGQRGTDSQTIRFEDVFVPDGWHYDEARDDPFYPLAGILGQAALVHGIGQGALDATIAYMRGIDRPTMPMFGAPSTDPILHRRLGEMAAQLAASRALVLTVAEQVERAETSDQVGEFFVQAIQADVVSAHVTLSVTSELFEVTGARSTANTFRLDRFWRNARTMTTHHSHDAASAMVGSMLFNETMPLLTDYIKV